jgi:hypothetical protein
VSRSCNIGAEDALGGRRSDISLGYWQLTEMEVKGRRTMVEGNNWNISNSGHDLTLFFMLPVNRATSQDNS